MAARAAIAQITPARLSELANADLETLIWHGREFLALDEFSYCHQGATGLSEQQLSHFEKSPVVDKGARFETDILSASDRVKVKGETRSWTVNEWSIFLPTSLAAGIKITLDINTVHVQTTQAAEVVSYVYLNRRFTPEELLLEKPLRCGIRGQGEGDLRLVFVFDDENNKKISHVMAAVNARALLSKPEKCKSIRVGFRFCGRVDMQLGVVEFADPDMSNELFFRHNSLLCVPEYPSYDDLYRYAFVHTRVLAYKDAGFSLDLMKVGRTLKPYSREFSGIDVIEANTATLASTLALGHHKHLIVHALTAATWDVIQPYLGKLDITVWAHGADIQPWFRRHFLFLNDEQRSQARKNTSNRMQAWRALLAGPADKTRVVFVSKFQAREALMDIGTQPQATICVVPNPIDTNLFHYIRKTPEMRFRVLSIRPFANRIYANDLTVCAILLLSQRLHFERFQFTLVGDGPLFDETVQPLLGFRNVKLIKRFLLQSEIAELHADHGIFLCPSRMDTHGVSRDEAMASGLVPVTSRVAAIPEFVDESCGFMAEPEDAMGLADAIEILAKDPERFVTMSEAAAARIRRTTAAVHVIHRELEILTQQPVRSAFHSIENKSKFFRVAIYGDVNLNIMDGSAVWAASLAETLSQVPNVLVTLFLKAPIKRMQILEPLLALSGRVQIVEPNLSGGEALTIDGAVREISRSHDEHRFDAIVLRGLDLCTFAIQQTWASRIWAYITDLPQSRKDVSPDIYARIDRIIRACDRLLCQTRAFEDYVHDVFASAHGKTSILSPMIPHLANKVPTPRAKGPLRLVYAGKFAPLWGLREMFRAFDVLRQQLPDAELHVFGDKFHNPKDDPSFRDDVKRALESQDGVRWHGAVGRNELLCETTQMDIAWAYRDAELESKTHELSTKLLEYAAVAVPVIVARNNVNEELLGSDYPLFANTEQDATLLLCHLEQQPSLVQRARVILRKAAESYTFSAVSQSLVAQGLFERKLVVSQQLIVQVTAE